MTTEVVIKKSNKAGKKYDAVIDGKKDCFIWCYWIQRLHQK